MLRTALASRTNRVVELTEEHRCYSLGDYNPGHGSVPMLVTALEDLIAHGPMGPVRYRAGAGMPKRGLVPALDNTLE